ncbi:MAG: hypothetical protein PWQ15_1761 [Methanobacterium sp.]|uniref:hypothetical protein n=1 Tax=Methanobacterium sp. TaxID=2164 RepID=UPI0024ABFE88|nr:hypothetical protein [Methanobacterium sp.]MDI3550658.1 hypothetical protein [Methanobacterium sp.]
MAMDDIDRELEKYQEVMENEKRKKARINFLLFIVLVVVIIIFVYALLRNKAIY